MWWLKNCQTMNFTMLKATCWQYREVVDQPLHRMFLHTCCCTLQACMPFLQTSRCWRRLADNIGRLWISRYIECFSIHVVAHCKPACRFCIPTSHFRCLVQMRLQTLSDVLTVSRWVFLQIGGTWRTQACRISKCIFYFTNVVTEELSNHELHDVEGDLLTISGGCGWCSI